MATNVKIIHFYITKAKTSEDAEEGLLFMQEMIELSKLQQEQPENPPRAVTFIKPSNETEDTNANDNKVINAVTLLAGPAQFGVELNKNIIVSFLFLVEKCILCFCLQ